MPAFYERMDVVWAGGDDARASISTVLSGDYASPEALERLAWWLAFHLHLGFRWCFLYVADSKTKSRCRGQGVLDRLRRFCFDTAVEGRVRVR